MAPTVLLIDDSIFMRAMLKRLATDAGLQVVGEAGNGQEGIEQFKALHPTVVVLDIIMPVMDGLQALEAIRKSSPKAVVVMCSSSGQQAMIDQARQLGARDFIVKPFDHKEVTTVLRAAAGL